MTPQTITAELRRLSTDAHNGIDDEHRSRQSVGETLLYGVDRLINRIDTDHTPLAMCPRCKHLTAVHDEYGCRGCDCSLYPKAIASLGQLAARIDPPRPASAEPEQITYQFRIENRFDESGWQPIGQPHMAHLTGFTPFQVAQFAARDYLKTHPYDGTWRVVVYVEPSTHLVPDAVWSPNEADALLDSIFDDIRKAG